MKKISIIAMFFFFTLTSFAAKQNTIREKEYSFSIPQHGKLILVAPSLWEQTFDQPPGGLPPTITFSPKKGNEFKVLITPLWSPKNDSKFNEPEKIKKLVESELKEMISQAIEKKAQIQEFIGNDGKGYYFLLTDKAPKPGDYPYVVIARIGVGDLLLQVTILSRSKTSDGITRTIGALQKAKQVYE